MSIGIVGMKIAVMRGRMVVTVRMMAIRMILVHVGGVQTGVVSGGVEVQVQAAGVRAQQTRDGNCADEDRAALHERTIRGSAG